MQSERLLKDAAPAETFTVTEICRRIYGYPEAVSRAHSVSVRRALRNVLTRNPDWHWGPKTRRNRNAGDSTQRMLRRAVARDGCSTDSWAHKAAGRGLPAGHRRRGFRNGAAAQKQ